jgi:hypothetical protein
MVVLAVYVHEMFYPLFGPCPGRSSVAQIEHETGIACGQAPESGGGHAGPAKEGFDLANQHGGS